MGVFPGIKGNIKDIADHKTAWGMQQVNVAGAVFSI